MRSHSHVHLIMEILNVIITPSRLPVFPINLAQKDNNNCLVIIVVVPLSKINCVKYISIPLTRYFVIRF